MILRPDNLVVNEIIFEKRAVAMDPTITMITQIEKTTRRVGNNAPPATRHGQADLLYKLKVVVHILDIHSLVRENVEIVVDSCIRSRCTSSFPGKKDEWKHDYE